MTLDEYLKQSGITANELAQRAGLSYVAISRYRNGHRVPSMPALIKIGRATEGAVGMGDFPLANARAA